MRPVRPLSSLRDWRIGLPTSSDSVRASSGMRSTTSSRNLRIAARRFLIGVAAQSGCARRARSYFARTDLALSAATSASTAPVAGLVIFMGTQADAKSFSKSADVHLRGLVWWQMSAVAISTRRGMSPRCTARGAQ